MAREVIRFSSDHVAIELPQNESVEVIVLPDRTNASIGYYNDGAMETFKDLSDAHIKVSHLQDSEHRQWIVKNGFKEYSIEFLICILGEAAWYVIQKKIESAKPDTPVKGKICKVTETNGKQVQEWYEIEGTAKEVAFALPEIMSKKNRKE